MKLSSATACARRLCWPRTATSTTSGRWRPSATPRGIPAYIHPDDRALLSDPARGLSLGPGQQLFGGLTFTEPDDVLELTDGMTLDIAGVTLIVDHAPGHTPGSVTFRLPAAADA